MTHVTRVDQVTGLLVTNRQSLLSRLYFIRDGARRSKEIDVDELASIFRICDRIRDSIDNPKPASATSDYLALEFLDYYVKNPTVGIGRILRMI